MNTLLLNNQELESLKNLIVYVLGDEKKHYEECEPEDRQNHIYNHIRILNNALKN